MNKPIMNGNHGSTDFQVGLNDVGEVVVVIDGQEFTKDDLLNAINGSGSGSSGSGSGGEGGESSGGSSTGIIALAKDVTMTFNPGDNTDSDEGHTFTAVIPKDNVPDDFLTVPGRYNLIIVVHGNNEGQEFGYTANHFCYMYNNEGFYNAQCTDKSEDTSITHFTIFGLDENGDYSIMYSGLMGSNKVLPSLGAMCSVFLQQLY